MSLVKSSIGKMASPNGKKDRVNVMRLCGYGTYFSWAAKFQGAEAIVDDNIASTYLLTFLILTLCALMVVPNKLHYAISINIP